MSKKLIAVASAAALALTALVGVAPANANTTALGAGFVASTGNNDASTAEKPATINVPAKNILTEAADTAGLIDIGTTAGATIEITTTGSVKVIRSLTGLTADSANWNVANLGKSAVSYAAVGSASDDAWVYSTTTTTGSVTVKVTTSAATLTNTYYIKGVAGLGHSIKVTAPETLAKGKAGTISATVADIFGNAVEDKASATYGLGKISITVDRFPSASAAAVTSGLVWNSTAKNYQAEITSASSAPFTVQVSLTVDDGTSAFVAAPDILGIADAVDVAIVNINAPASATATSQVATLTAQVAALTTQLAASVTKKRFNTLARKWNKAFPSQKVALKK